MSGHVWTCLDKIDMSRHFGTCLDMSGHVLDMFWQKISLSLFLCLDTAIHVRTCLDIFGTCLDMSGHVLAKNFSFSISVSMDIFGHV